MYENLEQLGLNIIQEEKELFNSFSSIFTEYNEKINLISNSDVRYLFEKHIYDSLAFNLFYERYAKNKKIKLMDIGTGGGFPALPISLYYKNVEVVALDSINKKINFIKYAADILNIKNITPICSRVEDLSSMMRSSFDVVVTRAMAELRIVLEYAIPFVKVGGYFVAYKSIKAEEEIENAKTAMKLLNSKIVDKIEYSLPIEEQNKRVLLVIKKEKEVASSYPRKNGQVKKNPL